MRSTSRTTPRGSSLLGESESESESDIGAGDASDFRDDEAKGVVPPCSTSTSLNQRPIVPLPPDKWRAVAMGLKLRIFNEAAHLPRLDEDPIPCMHLGLLADQPLFLDDETVQALTCENCSSSGENWLCLTCHKTFCSRFVRGHMFKHGLRHQHPISMSLRDKSIWCYECDRYLSDAVAPALALAIAAASGGVEVPPAVTAAAAATGAVASSAPASASASASAAATAPLRSPLKASARPLGEAAPHSPGAKRRRVAQKGGDAAAGSAGALLHAAALRAASGGSEPAPPQRV